MTVSHQSIRVYGFSTSYLRLEASLIAGKQQSHILKKAINDSGTFEVNKSTPLISISLQVQQATGWKSRSNLNETTDYS